MSSNEESDDEFESADEELDLQPHSRTKLEFKNQDLDEITHKVESDKQSKGQLSAQFDKQLNLKSIVSLEKKEKSQKCPTNASETRIETRSRTLKEKVSFDIIPEGSQMDVTEEGKKTDIKVEQQTSDEISKTSVIDKNKTKESKTIIKGRKVLRKADRLREQTITGELQNKEEVGESKEIVSLEKQEMPEKISQHKKEIQSQILQKEEESVEIKTEEKTSDEIVIEENDETKEEKIIIKGRKLLRKAERLREENTTEESKILEEKKIEVLNKLSGLSEREDNSSKWNNWFTDIKSAAMTATSTTVSHVSQASNKWSINPKSLLTSAVSITSNVGSGISSVVENVSSVMDSAIGAPPPEHMAALVNTDNRVEKTSESDKQNMEINENQNKSSLGFGLFDYTLNTLESIGKKTMEVIVDDKQNRVTKTDKKD